jgi:hypothetical protein
MTRLILALGLVWAFAQPAAAQTPEDTVRWIYDSMAQPGQVAEQRGLWHLSRPERRNQFFSRRLVDFIIANDSHGNDLVTACIDFDPAIPGNDYDGAEILNSLTLGGSGDTTRRTVTARFMTFGRPAQIEYDFIVEDGFWKIDDIAGPGWRISQIACAPKAAAAPAASNAFCYLNGSDSLRLDLQADGSAMIDMQSWQANGHSCSARGRAGPAEGGWLFQAEEGCRLEIRVTGDQGIAFADPDWACKRWMCGQRAVIDGLSFPRSSQIDCAQMPPGN